MEAAQNIELHNVHSTQEYKSLNMFALSYLQYTKQV